MQSGRGVFKFTNLSTDQEMESYITDVIGAVVLFVAITLMYLHILKLIFGMRKELTQQSQIIQPAEDSLQETLRQMKQVAEKPLEPASDLNINNWLRKGEQSTPRSIYPPSCNSDGSFNTVIQVINASDMYPITPRSDVSLEDFWRRNFEETSESRLNIYLFVVITLMYLHILKLIFGII